MASDLKGLIQESLGPLPRVCQEQVILDLERARMTAEDYRQGNAVMHRYVDGRGNDRSETWRKSNRSHVETINEMHQTIENIAKVVKWHENGQTDASGRPLTDEDCFTQIRAEVQAHGFLNSSDDEMSDEEDEVDDMVEAAGSTDAMDEDEEQGVFCETCDGYYRQGVVAWFTEPFTHNGRTLYSACAVCRWRLDLEDRPVAHW